LDRSVRLYDYGEFYLIRDGRILVWTGLTIAALERESPCSEVLALAVS